MIQIAGFPVIPHKPINRHKAHETHVDTFAMWRNEREQTVHRINVVEVKVHSHVVDPNYDFERTISANSLCLINQSRLLVESVSFSMVLERGCLIGCGVCLQLAVHGELGADTVQITSTIHRPRGHSSGH